MLLIFLNCYGSIRIKTIFYYYNLIKTKRAVFMKSTFLILEFINMLFLCYIKFNIKSNKF
nr:MAG TPA: hypothetical protein [Caudoviricetes sp.]